MGAGGSVLTPELASKLYPENLEKFYQYRAQCDKEGMSQETAYSFLTQKYDELIKIQTEAEQELEDELNDEEVVSFKRPPPVNITNAGSKFEEEEFLAELKKVLDAEDVKKFENLDDFDSSYTAETVKKVFLMDHYERLHHNLTAPPKKVTHAEKDEYTFNPVTNIKHTSTPATAHNHSVLSSASGDLASNSSDGGNHQDDLHLECHLCNISFDSQVAMGQHLDHSEMHRKAMANRAKKIEEAHAEAIRLTGIATNVMQTLWAGAGEHKAPTSTSTPQNVHTELSRANIHSSSVDAIENRSATGVSVDENKNENENENPGNVDADNATGTPSNSDPSSPTTSRALAHEKAKQLQKEHIRAKKIHLINKQHWKNAAHFLITRHLSNQFRHKLENRIETPRGKEIIFKGSKFFHRTGNTYDLHMVVHHKEDILEIVPHYVPFNHDTSKIEETAENFFEPAKRIYLVYSELYKAFMGAHNPHGMHSRMGVEPDDVLGHTPKLLHGNSFKESELKALGSYISNRLKIHKSHARTDAIFFDLHGINHDMLVKTLPEAFTPLPVNLKVIQSIWHEQAAPTPSPRKGRGIEEVAAAVGTAVEASSADAGITDPIIGDQSDSYLLNNGSIGGSTNTEVL